MLLEKVKNTVKRYRFLERGDSVVVAVSGGPDSTALLFVLNDLKYDYLLKLSIANFNHMFRGAGEAKKDRDYVYALSQRLRLPLIFGEADVPAYARKAGLSLEEAAREKRYEFLLNTAKEVGASKIAFGHTLDDQAETVLMRMIRGAGLGGLRGIPPSRKMDGKLIIRPLIEAWRSDVEVYLRALNIKPRQDITNTMTKFLRNRIRHELLAYLKGYNPNIKEALVRNAQSLTYDYEVLADLIDREFERCAKINRHSVRIPLRNFKTKPTGIRRGILRKAIEVLKGDLRRIDYSHIEDIEGLIEANKGALDLPDKIRVSRAGNSLIFNKTEEAPRSSPSGLRPSPSGKIRRQLLIPGKTHVPELGLIFESEFVRTRVRFGKPTNVEYMDYARLKHPLYLRTWEKGDRFKPLGMASEKKLQDFYVDGKIPRGRRSSIPLVVSGRKIIWVCGLRLSDEVKMTSGTRRILKLSYKRAA
ncbi:MAG: tRNA lysidine(34) synthetase TilS [Candidatus Omnitrophota bacterium]|nr:tRNA lysidine(34) synthetase TilS [Candidatus Omnitrophota bacterium]